MIQIPVRDIIAKIVATGVPEDEVRRKISEKIEQLYGLVSEEGAAHIIANEYGIKLFDISGELKIKDILIGMKSVDLVGKVLRKFEMREFATEKRKGKVANLLLGDETGSVRVVFWNEKTDNFSQLKEDDVLRIRGAYIRDNAGRKELHLGDNSRIIINPPNVSVNTRERKEYSKRHILELIDGMSAEIVGTIVQVFDVKFFEVCPKCNKRLRLREDKFFCDEHQEQQPSYNYVLNLYLDDGTGNVRTIFWKNQLGRLLKDTNFESVRKDPVSFEKYKNDLLGTQIKVLGTAKNNMMGRLELSTEVVFTDLNPEHEMDSLDHMREIALDTNIVNKVSENNPLEKGSSQDIQHPRTQDIHQHDGDGKTVDDTDEFEISEDFLE